MRWAVCSAGAGRPNAPSACTRTCSIGPIWAANSACRRCSNSVRITCAQDCSTAPKKRSCAFWKDRAAARRSSFCSTSTSRRRTGARRSTSPGALSAIAGSRGRRRSRITTANWRCTRPPIRGRSRQGTTWRPRWPPTASACGLPWAWATSMPPSATTRAPSRRGNALSSSSPRISRSWPSACSTDTGRWVAPTRG